MQSTETQYAFSVKKTDHHDYISITFYQGSRGAIDALHENARKYLCWMNKDAVSLDVRVNQSCRNFVAAIAQPNTGFTICAQAAVEILKTIPQDSLSEMEASCCSSPKP